jgi:hypothetical protein
VDPRGGVGVVKERKVSVLVGNQTPINILSALSSNALNLQNDSKLLSGFPWPIIFKLEIIK